ncbi:MAG: hypothetical protein Q8L66_15345 [Caulobacter sp.]|nr:hypothetical protein [Caulobacter sp.]
MKKTIGAALLAATILAGGPVAIAAPTDARSCAVRFVAMRNMSSYAVNDPKSQAQSKIYGIRAAEVAAKGKIIPSATSPLPKDLTDEGAALVVRFMNGLVSDVQLAGELTACQAVYGYDTLN